MRVFAIGRTEILYAAIKEILEKTKHQIVAIVTAHSQPEYKKHPNDFKELALTCGAEFYITEKIDNTVFEIVNNTKPDAGISINWVSIINESFLNMFPFGIINAHFADLPRYRGNAATNWAILLNEKQIHFTLHFMQPDELDSGDILLQDNMPLNDSTTIADIIKYAQIKVPSMFVNALNGLENNTIVPLKQKERGIIPFRCYPRLPCDGKIDWNQPARNIHNLIRSLTKPYSGAFTYYRDNDKLHKLYIWESRVVSDSTIDLGVPGHVIKNDIENGESWIYTGKGIIAITLVSHGQHGELFKPGHKWKSIRMRLGLNVEEEIMNLFNTLLEVKNNER